MKRLIMLLAVLAMVMVLTMASLAMAQEVSVSPIINLPAIWGTELISSAGPTVLLVKVWTPFDDARYRIKWRIFNHRGVKVRDGDSGWFWWQGGTQLYYETPVDTLKGNGYYVKTNLQYAVFVEN